VTLVFGHGPVDGIGAPINQLSSYPECWAAGAEGVELDVRVCVDRGLAVTHDPILPDGRPVAEVSAAELPAHVPLLQQVLDATTGLIVNIEIKNYPGDPAFDPGQRVTRQILELLAGRSGADRVLISCFDVAALDLVLAEARGLSTALLYLSRRPPAELLAIAVDHGHRTVHPYDTMVDQAFMDLARDRSLQVNVWSADDAPTSRLVQLVSLGVDGLITPQVTAARSAVTTAAAF
jgi:glycerophosphoryl diester phosphodiesterase